MRILDLELSARDLHSLHDFYGTTLGFEVDAAADHPLTIQAGATRLTFVPAPDGSPHLYHFAFNIPENQLSAAKEWLSTRTPLLTDSNGFDEFNFESWHAHSVYFKDPAGNILEFIARHDLPNATGEPFGPRSILSVSEIGLATNDVPSLVRSLPPGVPVYGEVSETFTAVGDELGLLIIVKTGRVWFPDTGVSAQPEPARITFQTES